MSLPAPTSPEGEGAGGPEMSRLKDLWLTSWPKLDGLRV